VITRLTGASALFALTYLGAATALSAGWVRVFVLALCASQAVAIALLLHRPGGLRARMRRSAPRPLAAAAPPPSSVSAERVRSWAITAAVVGEARLAVPVPASEPAGDGEGTGGDALLFWGLADADSQSAVELFRRRADAEAVLADALIRDPSRRGALSVVPLDLDALGSGALERAGVRGGVGASADPLGRALALAAADVRGRG
jgi:hypothetical protein